MQQLTGTITALITPFIEDEIDEEGLIALIRDQLDQGINGILFLGSTGESATLTSEEEARILTLAHREIRGKVPILAGTGSYSTRQTIEKTKKAKDLGADIAFVVTPYYNKPTQEGIFRHFEAITQAVDLPILIYNIPGRCGTNIETKTLLRIAALPNIIGVKEASGNICQVGDVYETIVRKYPHFALFSGDDNFTLPMMALGARGVISVISNLIPRQMIEMVDAALSGDYSAARKLHFELLPLFKAVFMETNPIPIKTAMNLCGKPAGPCRLPLCEMNSNNVIALTELLKEARLLS
jgi:4-hydroxy-tetrahydrodipicolinate synthase